MFDLNPLRSLLCALQKNASICTTLPLPSISIFSSLCLSLSVSLCLYLSLSLSLSFCLCLSVCLFVSLYLPPPLSLSLSLSLASVSVTLALLYLSFYPFFLLFFFGVFALLDSFISHHTSFSDSPPPPPLSLSLSLTPLFIRPPPSLGIMCKDNIFFNPGGISLFGEKGEDGADQCLPGTIARYIDR